MEIRTPQAVVRITCGGRPLEGPYMPPPLEIRELARYLAAKYGDLEPCAKEAEPCAV